MPPRRRTSASTSDVIPQCAAQRIQGRHFACEPALRGLRLDERVARPREETGLDALSHAVFLGVAEFDARSFGKDELHVRHFFQVRADGVVPERWRHYERDPADGSAAPIAFELYWLPLATAADALVAGHGVFIPGIHLVPDRE